MKLKELLRAVKSIKEARQSDDTKKLNVYILLDAEFDNQCSLGHLQLFQEKLRRLLNYLPDIESTVNLCQLKPFNSHHDSPMAEREPADRRSKGINYWKQLYTL